MLSDFPNYCSDFNADNHCAYLVSLFEGLSGDGLPPKFEDSRLYIFYCVVSGLSALGALNSVSSSRLRTVLNEFVSDKTEFCIGQTPLLRLSITSNADFLSLFFFAAISDLLGEQTLILYRNQIFCLFDRFRTSPPISDLRTLYAFVCLSRRFEYAIANECRAAIVSAVNARRAFDHGYAFDANGESHAAATFLSLATLRLLGASPLNTALTAAWLAARQTDWGHSVGL